MKSKKTFCSLTKKGDFKRVFDSGSKFSSKFLVVYARANGLTVSRVGLAVGRKIGGAVVRNRIKRRLREAVRRHLKDLSLHFDIVIVARKASAGADFADLNKNTADFFSGLGNESNIDSNNKII